MMLKPRCHSGCQEFRSRSIAAFTLLEMLVTLTVIAAIAAVVAPMLSDDTRLRVMAASSIMSSDIELAQVMTISHPDLPVTVKFDADKATYWLAYAVAPDTPITRDDTGEPYSVTLGAGRARGAAGVTLALDQMTGGAMTFAAHGGLTDFTTTPLIKFACGTRGIQLSIAPDTGSITESEFTPQQKQQDAKAPPVKGG
jgi:prepilin-type N-terminal cleavage/methylation domain-containing protein